MEITVKCLACRSALPVPPAEGAEQIECGGCGRIIPLVFGQAPGAGGAVERCPVCQGAEFYSRKDFDPKLGVTVVAIGALISAGFYWFGMDLVAYGVLAAAALLDFVVYQRLDEVTVCYRCHAEFRGAYRPAAPAFDLHTADVLEQEYARRIGRQ